MGIDTEFLVVLTGTEIGAGETDLGEKLTELWLKTLATAETRPAKIVFLNTEGTPHLETLEALEEQGTQLVSCITCLNYYDRMDRVVVGERGDMKGTIADMTGYRKVVTL
jgi:hypothetical protein